MLRSVTTDDVFYDVGANVGTHSCFLGSIASQVVAIEPHPGTAARLRENLKRNNIAARIYELALSDETGTTELVQPRDTSDDLGSGEFSIHNTDEGAHSWTVETIRGDELVARDELPIPTVVKIDVEGAEINVIDGFTETLRDVELVYCEVHPPAVSVDEVRERLESLEFTVEMLSITERNHSFLK